MLQLQDACRSFLLLFTASRSTTQPASELATKLYLHLEWCLLTSLERLQFPRRRVNATAGLLSSANAPPINWNHGLRFPLSCPKVEHNLPRFTHWENLLKLLSHNTLPAYCPTSIEEQRSI